MNKIIVPILIAAFAALTTLPAGAADDAKPAATATRGTPLRGKIDSVDKQAKTFKINERTFHLTSDTKIMKAGKAATFDDLAVGNDVGGLFREGSDKKLNVVSLRVGPRPDDAPKKEDKSK
jgi:hypothetical protein